MLSLARVFLCPCPVPVNPFSPLFWRKHVEIIDTNGLQQTCSLGVPVVMIPHLSSPTGHLPPKHIPIKHCSKGTLGCYSQVHLDSFMRLFPVLDWASCTLGSLCSYCPYLTAWVGRSRPCSDWIRIHPKDPSNYPCSINWTARGMRAVHA